MSYSYSSMGEDSVLFGILKRAEWLLNKNIINSSLFYIDIGCFHPIDHSNTYLFYKNNWKGILVDPNPTLENIIKKERPRDIFLNSIVSKYDNQKLSYYYFGPFASSNTVDKNFADWISSSQNIPIKNIYQINSISLDTIVNMTNENIFLLNIDVEGLDKEIITNYSWKKRPTFIWIEDWDRETKKIDKEILNFLNEKKYYLIANVYLTSLYIDMESEIYTKLCT